MLIRLWYFIFLAALGFSIAQFKAISLNTPMLKKTVFTESIEGVVQDIDHTSRGLKLLVKVNAIRDFPDALKIPEKVSLRLNGRISPEISIGSVIEAKAKLFPVEDALVPGGFDFKRRAYFLGIGASGIIYKIQQVENPSSRSWVFWIKNLRKNITATLYRTLPGPTGSIASALITGEKGRIPPALRDAFADVGIAHILAISGLHLSLVGGLIFFVIRRGLAFVPSFSLRHNTKKWAAFLSIFAAFFYLQISGGATPIQRAFLMFLAAMVAILLDRQILTLRTVAIAAFGILCVVPESLMMPSFQLSFAAVVALISIYENGFFRRFLNRDQGYFKKVVFYIVGMLGTTVMASLATMPFTIYHFHKFTGLGLMGNLLAIPLLSFWIMPLAIVGVILMPFGFATTPLELMGKGIDWMIRGVDFITQHSGFIYQISPSPAWGFGAAIFGGLMLCLLQGKKRFLGLMGIILFFISLFFHNAPQIYISADLKTIAFMTPDGKLAINKARHNTFMGNVWSSWAGIKASNVVRFQDLDSIKCNEDLCQFKVGEKKVVYLKDLRGFSEVCQEADILISQEPLRGLRYKCPSAQFIMDRFDGWRNGSYVMWVKDVLRVLSARDVGGRRWGGIKRMRGVSKG